jgi:hypothetical protein
LHETLCDKVWIFCDGNELKFTYEHLQFQKIFLGSLALAIQGRGGPSMEGEGRGQEGRRGEGRGEERVRRKGGEGGRGISPPKHKNLTPPRRDGRWRGRRGGEREVKGGGKGLGTPQNLYAAYAHEGHYNGKSRVNLSNTEKNCLTVNYKSIIFLSFCRGPQRGTPL